MQDFEVVVPEGVSKGQYFRANLNGMLTDVTAKGPPGTVMHVTIQPRLITVRGTQIGSSVGAAKTAMGSPIHYVPPTKPAMESHDSRYPSRMVALDDAPPPGCWTHFVWCLCPCSRPAADDYTKVN